MYVPAACETQNMCKLHVFTHGCGMAAHAGPGAYAFNDTYARRAGFNGWAEANNIVVLYPQLHYGTRANCAAQSGDCWDQGGTTGEAWADKGGQQVKCVKAMIDRLIQDRPPDPGVRQQPTPADARRLKTDDRIQHAGYTCLILTDLKLLLSEVVTYVLSDVMYYVVGPILTGSALTCIILIIIVMCGSTWHGTLIDGDLIPSTP